VGIQTVKFTSRGLVTKLEKERLGEASRPSSRHAINVPRRHAGLSCVCCCDDCSPHDDISRNQRGAVLSGLRSLYNPVQRDVFTRAPWHRRKAICVYRLFGVIYILSIAAVRKKVLEVRLNNEQ
jgi:hypothetical protein